MNPAYKVEKMIINDCKMTDKGFSMIIEALINHRDTIRSLEYNKN